MTIEDILINRRIGPDDFESAVANVEANNAPTSEPTTTATVEWSIDPPPTTLPTDIETGASDAPRALARVSRDRSKEEFGDSYSGVLFQIPGRNWRVAVDRVGYQWMLQQREARDHWQSRKFFARKARLAKVIEETFGRQIYLAVCDHISKLPI